MENLEIRIEVMIKEIRQLKIDKKLQSDFNAKMKQDLDDLKQKSDNQIKNLQEELKQTSSNLFDKTEELNNAQREIEIAIL